MMTGLPKFYIVPTWRCFTHRDKAAGWEVKGPGGERYRYACTEACAKRQAAELEQAHAK